MPASTSRLAIGSAFACCFVLAALLLGMRLPDKEHSLYSSLMTIRAPKERPIVAVMIENHQQARPHHAGLGKALWIQEFIVEGGISRFAALFDLADLPPIAGPVRSLRPYFIESVSPMTSLLLFAGGSPEALLNVQQVKGLYYINGLGYPQHFDRNRTIAAPHNLFITSDNIKDLAGEVTMRSVAWPPYKTGRVRSQTGATVINLNFFGRNHNVEYTYASGEYVRQNGDVVSDASPENVLVLESPILGVGEVGRLTIDMTGRGDALLFRSGKVVEGTWKKTATTEPFVFTDKAGEPLVFAKGQTWMTVLPTLERVTWR